MYIKKYFTEELYNIVRTDTNTVIPRDIENKDYRAFLQWLKSNPEFEETT